MKIADYLKPKLHKPIDALVQQLRDHNRPSTKRGKNRVENPIVNEIVNKRKRNLFL